MGQDKKHILLLVEDNPLLVGLYKAAFEKHGINVLFAHDGETGLAVAKEKKPEIILLDILMPGVSGLEMLENLRKDPQTKEIKVIILSIVTENETRQKVEALGVTDYLIKSEMKLGEIVDRVAKHF